jgi:hypothetical protein
MKVKDFTPDSDLRGAKIQIFLKNLQQKKRGKMTVVEIKKNLTNH